MVTFDTGPGRGIAKVLVLPASPEPSPVAGRRPATRLHCSARGAVLAAPLSVADVRRNRCSSLVGGSRLGSCSRVSSLRGRPRIRSGRHCLTGLASCLPHVGITVEPRETRPANRSSSVRSSKDSCSCIAYASLDALPQAHTRTSNSAPKRGSFTSVAVLMRRVHEVTRKYSKDASPFL